MTDAGRSINLHAGFIALLALLPFVLPDYHVGNLSRIMVLAIYAIGYNLLFGYTGLLSLGHALFFAAGMYGLGLPMYHLGVPAELGLLCGLVAALAVAGAVGFLALRTSGVAFMIVTLMFAQAGYLTILLMVEYTRGDEGFVLQQASRMLGGLNLIDPSVRYFASLGFLAAVLCFIAWLVRTPFGRCLVAIRENEERARMLGYDTIRHKLAAVMISGAISGLSGAVYALMFGYAGATFGSVQYSILPLIWVLLGGVGTTIGPVIGTAFMFYLIDLSSEITSAYMIIAGVVLVLLTLFAPQGLLGELRLRYLSWLP